MLLNGRSILARGLGRWSVVSGGLTRRRIWVRHVVGNIQKITRLGGNGHSYSKVDHHY